MRPINKLNPTYILSALALIFTLISYQTFADSAALGSIRGIVIDSENRMPVINSEITLLNHEVQVASVVASVTGEYDFSGLENGTYLIQVFAAGFESKSIEQIHVEGKGCNRINIVLSRKKEPLKSSVIAGSEAGQNQSASPEFWSSFNPGDDKDYQLSNPFAGNHGNNEMNPRNVDLRGEHYQELQENAFVDTKGDTNVSVFATNLNQSSYPNVRRFINSEHMPPRDAVRIEEMINYFQYHYPVPKDGQPFSFQTELAPCPWDKEHHLLQVGVQARKSNLQEVPPMNIVFVMDVSGSMLDSRKLPMVKESVKLLSSKLREEDRLTIMAYSHNYQVVLNATKGTDLKKIYQALDRAVIGGPTDGAIGLKYAYQQAEKHFIKGGVNRVVFATDGEFNYDNIDENSWYERLKSYRKEEVFLTILGYGIGNYKDSTLANLAKYANGNYFYIDRLEEAERVLSKEVAGSMMTVAKNVKVKIDFNPDMIGEFRLIGYANRQLDPGMKAHFEKDMIPSAGEMGSGQAITALYEVRVDNPDLIDGSIGRITVNYNEPGVPAPAKKGMRKMEQEISGTVSGKASANMKFVSAIAAYGMLLRESKYISDFDFGEVAKLAKEGTSESDDGYRKEFVRLVFNTTKVLDSKGTFVKEFKKK